jgi:hypothetical protein
LGVNDAATQGLLTKWIGATTVGPTEDRRLDQAVAALEFATPGEHTHPEYALDGHDHGEHSHGEYSPFVHTHPFAGTTEDPNP